MFPNCLAVDLFLAEVQPIGFATFCKPCIKMKYFRSAPEKKINVLKYFDKILNYMKEKSEKLL